MKEFLMRFSKEIIERCRAADAKWNTHLRKRSNRKIDNYKYKEIEKEI